MQAAIRIPHDDWKWGGGVRNKGFKRKQHDVRCRLPISIWKKERVISWKPKLSFFFSVMCRFQRRVVACFFLGIYGLSENEREEREEEK